MRSSAPSVIGALLVLIASAIADLAHADSVAAAGVRDMTVLSSERGMMLDVRVWYPAGAGGAAVSIGDNAVFHGAPARQDAAIAGGSLPVILLLHGGLRSAPDSGAWIASRLAAAGFVVAAPRPPRLEGARAKNAPAELWLRPADLSATLTALEDDPTFRSRLDTKAVGVLGFQLGGTAALALVGARIDGQRYARSCDRGGTGMDCDWFASEGIDLHGIDLAPAERSKLDRRVRAAVAVDPELSDDFDPTSLIAIAAPVRVINLGEPGSIRAELEASSLARVIPGALYETVAGATGSSAFNLCKPQAPAILRQEGDDEALCRDGQRPRAGVHALLAQMTASFFRAKLPNVR
jgi:predicted dienelactone hydrolase